MKTIRQQLNEVIYSFAMEPRDQITLDAIYPHFQLIYPGKYSLKWTNPAYSDDIDIVFETDHDRMLFLLQY